MLRRILSLKILAALLAVLGAGACFRDRPDDTPGTGISVGPARHDAVNVSLVQLIATPHEYSRKVVRVVGYLNIEFEGNAIYLHEEDFIHALPSNSLWVDAKPEIMAVMKKLSGRYVLLEGIFDASRRGHMSLRSGAVLEINRVADWTDFARKRK